MRWIQTAAAIALCAAAPGLAQAQCSVTGPDSVCPSQPADLCGDPGNNQWTWTGPSGEALGSARCIQVTAPGTYTLRQFDADNGLMFTCQRTLAAAVCDTTPPPPSTGPSCPRTAAWWWRQCRTAESRPSLSPGAFAAAASCADARSNAIDAKAGAAMCELIAPQGRTGTPRSRALRQFAVVQLNLCARAQGMPDSRGNAVGLDPGVLLVSVPGVAGGTTLGAWAASVDAELGSLAKASVRDRSARRAYQRIRMQAYLINHGRGCGSPCGATPMSNEPDDEPEESMLMQTSDAGLVIEGIAPNPSRGPVRIRWSLPRAADVSLAVVDIAGRTVRELASGQHSAGSNDLVWDGTADDGRVLRSGAYFVHGRVDGEVVQARMVLVR